MDLKSAHGVFSKAVINVPATPLRLPVAMIQIKTLQQITFPAFGTIHAAGFPRLPRQDMSI